ncbi:MAG: hypothetical protein KAS38_22830 [Anaerolineales bacterium]|nr:hypothetical protein [Anaerolineales bacterium]
MVGFGLSGGSGLGGFLVGVLVHCGMAVAARVLVRVNVGVGDGVGDTAIAVSKILVRVRFGVMVGKVMIDSSSHCPGPVIPLL